MKGGKKNCLQIGSNYIYFISKKGSWWLYRILEGAKYERIPFGVSIGNIEVQIKKNWFIDFEIINRKHLFFKQFTHVFFFETSYVVILIMEKIAFDPHSLMHDEEGDGHGHAHGGGHGHAHGGGHGHAHGHSHGKAEKGGHKHNHGDHSHHEHDPHDHENEHEHNHDHETTGHNHHHHNHDTTSLVSDNSIQAKSSKMIFYFA